MMQNRKPDLLILIAGLAIFVVGIGYLVLYLFGSAYQENLVTTPQAILTVLPAAVVPTVDTSYLVISPTNTPTPVPEGGSEFPIDSFVQITGTGGNGLRLRANPGTESLVNFVAAESEVFRVIGGPVAAGSYNWWQLVAPYDDSRQGWAAGDYLASINP